MSDWEIDKQIDHFQNELKIQISEFGINKNKILTRKTIKDLIICGKEITKNMIK